MSYQNTAPTTGIVENANMGADIGGFEYENDDHEEYGFVSNDYSFDDGCHPQHENPHQNTHQSHHSFQNPHHSQYQQHQHQNQYEHIRHTSSVFHDTWMEGWWQLPLELISAAYTSVRDAYHCSSLGSINRSNESIDDQDRSYLQNPEAFDRFGRRNAYFTFSFLLFFLLLILMSGGRGIDKRHDMARRGDVTLEGKKKDGDKNNLVDKDNQFDVAAKTHENGLDDKPDVQASTDIKSQSKPPSISFLVSYPYSGTHYFLELLQSYTGKISATSYASDAYHEEGADDAISIYPPNEIQVETEKGTESKYGIGSDHTVFPFWSKRPDMINVPWSPEVLITETRCSGYHLRWQKRRQKEKEDYNDEILCYHQSDEKDFSDDQGEGITPAAFEWGCRTIVGKNHCKTVELNRSNSSQIDFDAIQKVPSQSSSPLKSPSSSSVLERSGNQKGIEHNTGKIGADTYEGRVESYIRLVRHPLDNIASRFHGEYRSHQSKEIYPEQHQKSWAEKHPLNAIGMKQWCFDLDIENSMDNETSLFATSWEESKAELLAKEILQKYQVMYVQPSLLGKLLPIIPCPRQIVRYVQWHNLASGLVQEDRNSINHKNEIGKKRGTVVSHSMTVWFEDLKTLESRTNTLKKVSTSLGLPNPLSRGMEWKGGAAFVKSRSPDFNSWFSDDEIRATGKIIKLLSTDETWNILSRYFE